MIDTDTAARILAALVGAAVAWAGAQKLTAMDTWFAAARAQSLPRVVALVVPPVELLLGAALAVLEPAPVTLGSVTALLLVFTVFLVVQVSAGSTVPCACFGTRTSHPPSGRDIARNVLMIAALVIAAALN
ncbi:MAG: hypothetical protein RLZZ305_886 [Actinomycetota bacterium]|jgi:hypothetical protein